MAPRCLDYWRPSLDRRARHEGPNGYFRAAEGLQFIGPRKQCVLFAPYPKRLTRSVTAAHVRGYRRGAHSSATGARIGRGETSVRNLRILNMGISPSERRHLALTRRIFWAPHLRTSNQTCMRRVRFSLRATEILPEPRRRMAEKPHRRQKTGRRRSSQCVWGSQGTLYWGTDDQGAGRLTDAPRIREFRPSRGPNFGQDL